MVATLEQRIQTNSENLYIKHFTASIGDLKDERPNRNFSRYVERLDFDITSFLQIAKLPGILEMYHQPPERQIVTDQDTLREQLGPHAIKLDSSLTMRAGTVPGYPSEALLALGIAEAKDRLMFCNIKTHERFNEIFENVAIQQRLSGPAKDLLAVSLSQNIIVKGLSYATAKLFQEVAEPKRKNRDKSKAIDKNPADFYVRYIRDAKGLLETGNNVYEKLLAQADNSENTSQLLQTLSTLNPRDIDGSSRENKKIREAGHTINEYTQLQWLPEAEKV